MINNGLLSKKKGKKKAVMWHSSLCLIRLNVAWQIVFLRLFYLTVIAPAGTTVCWPTGRGTTASSDFINVLDGKGLQFCVINAYNLQKKKKKKGSLYSSEMAFRCDSFIALVCTYVLKYKKKAETPLPRSHSDWLICQGVAQHIVVKFNPPTRVFHSSFLLLLFPSVLQSPAPKLKLFSP